VGVLSSRGSKRQAAFVEIQNQVAIVARTDNGQVTAEAARTMSPSEPPITRSSYAHRVAERTAANLTEATSFQKSF